MTTHLQSTPPAPDAPEDEYPAALYCAVHGGVPGDVSFYRQVCAGARSVLELGCGGGRVLDPLLRDGLDVTGLDRSASLLAIAAARAPRADLVRADMRDFRLGRRFDRILIPFNGAYCMLEEGDLLGCLRAAHAHLAPQGLLVFDGYSADDFHAHVDPTGADEPEKVKEVDALGTRWDVLEHSSWDTARQRIDAVYTHVPADARPRVVATIAQRYLLSTQVEPLLAEAGFELLVLHGDFDQSAHDGESPHLIATARRSVDA